MSQLCITDRQENGSECLLTDQKIIHQVTRVLRMKKGDILFLQDFGGTRRCKVIIHQLSKEQIHAHIIEETNNQAHDLKKEVSIVLAMPNKFEKLELIVQKLSEIGIDRLVCRPSRRSLLKDIPEKKLVRLETIAREATEQSWGRKIPQIIFSRSLPEFSSAEIILFDYHERLQEAFPIYSFMKYKRSLPEAHIVGIIGPEGGFEEKEILDRKLAINGQVTLGNHVLRMETAAILAGWWMKSL